METLEMVVKIKNPLKEGEVGAAFSRALRDGWDSAIRREDYPLFNLLVLGGIVEIDDADPEEDVEELVETMAIILWGANGGYSPMEMQLTSIDGTRARAVNLGEEAYQQMMGRGQ